jgi:hypothetical protein
MSMYPNANNLIEAAHGVRAALDNLESTEDIAGLTGAVKPGMRSAQRTECRGRPDNAVPRSVGHAGEEKDS